MRAALPAMKDGQHGTGLPVVVVPGIGGTELQVPGKDVTSTFDNRAMPTSSPFCAQRRPIPDGRRPPRPAVPSADRVADQLRPSAAPMSAPRRLLDARGARSPSEQDDQGRRRSTAAVWQDQQGHA
jgi:hypothetical protein